MIQTILEIIGLLLIAVGFAMVSYPLALVYGGVVLVLAAVNSEEQST